MKLGIVSDTHKHIVNLSKAIEFLKEMGAGRIIHLGDDYEDIDEVGEYGAIRVPGVFSDLYQDKNIQNRRIENFVGWRFLLTHTLSSHANDLPTDPAPEELIKAHKIQAVLYGHTHIPEIRQENGIIFLNPGHLKNEDKKGYPPSLGYAELTINKVLMRIYRLRDHSIQQEEKYLRK